MSRRLLLDTCTFLWAVGAPGELSDRAADLIRDPDHEVYLSAVSAWEIAVKARLGRLRLPAPPDRWVPAERERHRISRLDLGEAAVLQLPSLPSLHRDPFDRMLVCQAIAEGLTVLTPDDAIRSYPVASAW